MSAEQWWMRAARPMCGVCKATGIKHAWNAEAHLVPTEPREPCPACNGSGWLGDDYVNPELTEKEG